MKKEYIIGGLALVGGIALVSYLLKPTAPRRNSEGFFGASGKGNSSIKNEFLLPYSFRRKPSLLEPCSTYQKIQLRSFGQPEFRYAKLLPQGGMELLSYEQFKNAYYTGTKCKY